MQMPSASEIAERQRHSIEIGDALGTVIYRPPTPITSFTDADTGEVFSTSDRAGYRNTRAYNSRRREILERKRGCDHCGAPAAFLWTKDVDAIGCEDVDNTVALCRHCNKRAYRGRQSLELVA